MKRTIARVRWSVRQDTDHSTDSRWELSRSVERDHRVVVQSVIGITVCQALFSVLSVDWRGCSAVRFPSLTLH